ncbi:TonB-dependent siderophore receptor [Planctobacterium marinum]|uniref:TonB-dependent siderophore receptor n=1 Tax=Planctobacterium marinum TaxID=1631968 RepID=UPI001E2EAEA3|nr:TonB-dependent siderophore receptor [Planctobacterium marinum]MCC2607645.1 TonB-dependent siderophore receptor [Planctobacterium marinum]
MNTFKRNLCRLAVVSALLPIVSNAQQNEQAAPASQDDNVREKIFEHIEVTGSRLDQATTATGLPLTLRETPQSISIIDSTLIDSFALDTVADVMQFAPGIQAQQAETDRYFFRSRGRDVTNFQLDGVPIAYNSFFSEALADSILFDRVEVVRGATGLLTGSGEPSAAINLIRKRPKMDNTGYASLEIGSWSNVRLEADHSQLLSDDGNVRARVAIAHEQGDSYVRLSEKDNTQVYAVVAADITDQTRITAGADYSERNPKGSMWGALPLFYSDGTQTDDLPVETTTASPWNSWAREGMNAFIKLEHAFDNNWNLQADIEQREDDMNGYLLYFSGFPSRETGEGFSASPNNYVSDREQTSVRLLLSGPFTLFGREHQLTAGLLHAKQDVDASSYGTADAIVIPSIFNWGQGVPELNFGDTPNYSTTESHTQQGVYAAAKLSLTDKLTAIIGNRITNYEYDAASPWASSKYDNDHVNTPYAGLVYAINRYISVYGSYTEIFQPQEARNANNELIGPVEGTNLELGIKGDFFNDMLSASVAVYEVEEDNLAISDPNNTEPLPGTTIFPSIAVKGAKTTGFEVELNGHITEQLNVLLSYTYNDAEDVDGSNFAPFLPKSMIKTSALYSLSDAITFGINANWQSKTENPGAGPNGETFTQDSYTVVNLMASYQLTPAWVLSANINNVFDEKYFSSIDFYNQGFFGAPRNAQASIRYSW